MVIRVEDIRWLRLAARKCGSDAIPSATAAKLITGNKRIVLFVAAMLVGAAMASVIGQRGARDASAPSARS